MTDDDPFADLGQTLEDEPDEEESTESTQATTESSTSESVAEEVPEYDPMSDPAFTYEDAQQRPFYAREQTIGDFDSWLKYELERTLNERGYQKIVVREMTDALLRTVVEEDLVDAVVQRFEQARDERTEPPE